MQWRFAKPILVALAFLVLLPLAASAQSTFTGQVRDESGGVLPGVTVEAASPALIEKVRTVVTDEQGRYRVVDLRPGVYKLTFTLTGFGTLVRDGVDLPANLVVTVNADLKVGTLAETVTVSGQAAQVDVQQASRTQVLNRDVLDALPASRNSMAVGYLAPGVRMSAPDIGGSNLTSQPGMRAHGMRAPHGVLQLVDGLSIATYEDHQLFYFDESAQSEVSVTTSAISAENSPGGIRINSILKDGGNSVSGAVFLGGTDGNWLSNNVDDKLRARGIRASNGVAHVQYFSGNLGGPIRKDKIWFIVGARHASNDNTVANVPEEIVSPKGEIVRAISDGYIRDVSVRLTWQATPKQKFATFVQRVWKRLGQLPFAFGTDPRTAYSRDPHHAHNWLGTAKWTMTPSSQWLVEGGLSTSVFNWQSGPNDLSRLQPRGTPLWYAMAQRMDTALNINPECAFAFGCTTWTSLDGGRTEAGRQHSMAAVSYVTGTHNLKVGFSNNRGKDGNKYTRNADLVQNYVNNRPSTVSVYNTPFDAPGFVDYDIGIYAQDAWTIKRLTLNPGLRVEWFKSSMNETIAAAGRFAPARFFPKQVAVRWGPDPSPRLSAAYDLFGDGKTAIKGNVSKYYEQLVALHAKRYGDAAVSSDSRNWFDTDLIPGTSTPSGAALPTNGDDIAQDNEIGPTSNPLFGLRADRNPAPDFRRLANWEYTAGVQHQLLPRVAVNAVYYRRTWDGVELTDRTLISRSDYTSFQIPMPSFANDPTLSGVLDPNEILTVYNLNPAKRSVFNAAQIDRNSENDKSIYTGVEVSFTARLGRGGNVFGSWNTERNVSVFCDSDDNPNGPVVADLYQGESVANGGRFCDERQFHMPFLREFKLAGNYPLAYGVHFGAVLQSYPGRERTITYTVPTSLFPGGRTNAETIILSKPGSLYQERYNQLDINVRKNFRIGRKVLTAQVDLFNALNGNAIFATNDVIGSSLGVVTSTLIGRMPRIAFDMKF